MKTCSALLLFVLACIGCSSARTEHSAPTRAFSSLTAEDLDICEALFRHQFPPKVAGRDPRSTFFISLFGDDPSDEFLRRFSDYSVPVKKGSQFRQGPTFHFGISSMKVLSPDAAEAEGGYYRGPLAAALFRYYLKKENGIWICYRVEGLGVSRVRQPNHITSLDAGTALCFGVARGLHAVSGSPRDTLP